MVFVTFDVSENVHEVPFSGSARTCQEAKRCLEEVSDELVGLFNMPALGAGYTQSHSSVSRYTQ